MNKIAYAAFLIAASMEAQTGPAAQQAAPAESEVASQRQPQQPPAITIREFRIDEKAVNKLFERGYFNPNQPHSGPATPTRCAIPLVSIPVQNKERFAGKTIPANSAIDPKIVLAPSLPACTPSGLQPLTTHPAPVPDKE